MSITDPRDIPGLLCWYSAEADAANYADDAAVTSLHDFSGLNNHGVVSGGAGGTLTLDYTGGPVGHRFVSTDSANRVALPAGVMAGCTAIEAYQVIKVPGATSTHWKMGTGSGENHYPYSGSLYDDFGRGGRIDGVAPGVSLNAWNTYSVKSAPNDWRSRMNGTSLYNTNSNTVAVPTQAYLLRQPSATVGSATPQELSLFLLYGRDLTTGERADLDTWVAANKSGGLAPDRPVTAAPGSPAALGLNDAAYLSWIGVAFASSYEYRVNGGAPVAVAAPAMKVLVTGLTNGTAVTLEVRGTNTPGPGPWSSVVNVTPVATLLYDDFERADSATVPGSPVQGGPWTVQQGVAGISSGQLYPPTTEMRITAPGAADIDFEAELGGTYFEDLSLIFRWASSSDFWAMQMYSNILRLYHVASGSFEEHKSVSLLRVPVAGDLLRIRAIGAMVYAYHNDRLVMEVGDRFHNGTQSAVGFRLMNSTHRIRKVTARTAVAVVGTGGQVTDLRVAAARPGTGLYKGRDTKALDIAGES